MQLINVNYSIVILSLNVYTCCKDMIFTTIQNGNNYYLPGFRRAQEYIYIHSNTKINVYDSSAVLKFNEINMVSVGSFSHLCGH